MTGVQLNVVLLGRYGLCLGRYEGEPSNKWFVAVAMVKPKAVKAGEYVNIFEVSKYYCNLRFISL